MSDKSCIFDIANKLYAIKYEQYYTTGSWITDVLFIHCCVLDGEKFVIRTMACFTV